MYTGTLENSRRTKLNDVFKDPENEENTPNNGTLIRSVSQPDFMHELNNNSSESSNQEAASIFVRPGIGSIAFRKSITNTLKTLSGDTVTEESSIGSAGSLAVRQRQIGIQPFDDDLSGK